MGNCTFCHRRDKKREGADAAPQHPEDGTKFACVHLQLHPPNPRYFDIVSEQTRQEMVHSARRLAEDFRRTTLKPVAEARGANSIYQSVRGIFEPQPGSNDLVQNYYAEELYGYPAAVWLFYLLNRSLDDPHIDVYELVDSECRPDSVIMLYRARTKKFLVVEPREYVMIRYVRRESPTSFVDVEQSADVLGLTTDPLIANALQRVKGALVKVYLKATLYEDQGLVCRGTSAAKSDMRSSAGLALLKPFLSASLKKSLPRLAAAIVEFYRRRQWEDGRQILWFDADYAPLAAAFNAAQQENDQTKVTIDQRAGSLSPRSHQSPS